jgi:hypothetical protein
MEDVHGLGSVWDQDSLQEVNMVGGGAGQQPEALGGLASAAQQAGWLTIPSRRCALVWLAEALEPL